MSLLHRGFLCSVGFTSAAKLICCFGKDEYFNIIFVNEMIMGSYLQNSYP